MCQIRKKNIFFYKYMTNSFFSLCHEYKSCMKFWCDAKETQCLQILACIQPRYWTSCYKITCFCVFVSILHCCKHLLSVRTPTIVLYYTDRGETFWKFLFKSFMQRPNLTSSRVFIDSLTPPPPLDWWIVLLCFTPYRQYSSHITAVGSANAGDTSSRLWQVVGVPEMFNAPENQREVAKDYKALIG